MTSNQQSSETGDETQEDDILTVYGKMESEDDDLSQLTARHRKFSPWHHPVKQIVRDQQWSVLASKLLNDRPAGAPNVLRYFTLPGDDLLDIKVLAAACASLSVSIEYFGFNSSIPIDGGEDKSVGVGGDSSGRAPWVMAESALRQAGRVTQDAIIHSDRLEDIALEHSHAAAQLRLQQPFDIINIDACDHLAYAPKGRERSAFDALQALLRHQMTARNPWLLFLTTRVDPALLGLPGIDFQRAITQNLGVPGSGFGAALAACLGAEEVRLATEINAAWSAHNNNFLKLYSVGLGKFLLQFFCGQPNLPANVELASVYAYRVYMDEPDMLALAFRIIPDSPRVYPPGTGGAAVIPTLEPVRAIRVAQRAAKLWDIDDALENNLGLRAAAITGTQKLLESANYDIGAWREWLANHEKRPIVISAS